MNNQTLILNVISALIQPKMRLSVSVATCFGENFCVLCQLDKTRIHSCFTWDDAFVIPMHM